MIYHIFTTETLPYSGLKVKIKELTGADYFAALSYSKGDPGRLIQSLLLNLVIVSETNKLLNKEQLDNMHISDIMRLSKIIDTMLLGF